MAKVDRKFITGEARAVRRAQPVWWDTPLPQWPQERARADYAALMLVEGGSFAEYFGLNFYQLCGNVIWWKYSRMDLIVMAYDLLKESNFGQTEEGKELLAALSSLIRGAIVNGVYTGKINFGAEYTYIDASIGQLYLSNYWFVTEAPIEAIAIVLAHEGSHLSLYKANEFEVPIELKLDREFQEACAVRCEGIVAWEFREKLSSWELDVFGVGSMSIEYYFTFIRYRNHRDLIKKLYELYRRHAGELPWGI